MNWTPQDLSIWLMENGFDKYIAKFKGIQESTIFFVKCSFLFYPVLEEEIDGLSLLNLSSSSIDELLSINTDNVIKKPTIGVKTTFEKKLEMLKANILSSAR